MSFKKNLYFSMLIVSDGVLVVIENVRCISGRNGGVVMLSESKNNKSSEMEKAEEFSIIHVIFDMAGTVLLSIVILLLIMAFFVRQVTVDGSSMNDTLRHEDRLLVQCSGYTPECGDIVIVTRGEQLDEAIVKRVIATEGQTLNINYATGEVVVDGVLLKEKYITGPTKSVMDPLSMPIVIPDGYVFVMGDNRSHSLDSRSERVGLIPVENIIGKAFFRWYPMDSFGTVS